MMVETESTISQNAGRSSDTAMIRMRLQTISLVLVMLGACAPIPHLETMAPAITGTVHRNDKPVDNAAVYFDYGRCSVESKYQTRTDREGHFEFELKNRFNVFSVYLVGRWEGWGVCIADGDAFYEGFDLHVYQLGNRNKTQRVTLDCNLENAAYTKLERRLRIKGICTSPEYK